MSQADLLRRVRNATSPADRRDSALDLLAATRSREHVDAALAALERDEVRALLGDAHRAALREKALFYFEHEDRDRGGLIREKIIRLLTAIRHRDDADLYLRGATTYGGQGAQTLRAASLAGLLAVDPEQAAAYAVRLLGEPDTSPLSGEPSITALAVLAHSGQPLPIYQFALLLGESFVRDNKGEVVSKALELIGGEIPPALYRSLAETFVALDSPVACSGIVNAIVEGRMADLYPLLEDMLARTRSDDLHRYGAIMLAASRVPDLTALLYQLARQSTRARLDNFVEAVELSTGDERDEILALLAKRRR
jgi:hypothetical protein